MPEISVKTAVLNNDAFIKVIGKGSFVNSHPIKKWMLDKLKQGCSSFLIDLSSCVTMDSTFMGTITGFSLKMKRLGNKPIILGNITEHNRRLLETLGLDRFLDIKEKIEIDSNVVWKELTVESLDKLTTTKHMVDAHEQLMDTDDNIKNQFKTVHEFLRKDLEKQLKRKKEEEK